ncbi:MAG TPA: photosynthetic reaction center cytochrome c subunit family protein [Vicinamibacterales bacterium]|nr:photosynthetic reaction center cytochrome c subunit family protein [Vicinamibacterales bacterium]
MKVTVLALVVLLGSAIQVQLQNAVVQTAGARYKSIRVLTDIPASMVIPTMAFVSNALGVTCLQCHTDVYESDEKPMKDKARDMIRLTLALNQREFGGRTVVTCETCHHGRVVPASVPDLANAGWMPRAPAVPQVPLPEASTVLERFAKAVGAEAFDALWNQQVSGTITRNSGRVAPASATFELYQEKPATFRLSTELSHPPEADAELPMSFLRPPLVAKTYPDLRVVSRADVNGRATVAAMGTSARGVHTLYFDAQTGLLVRRSDELATPLGLLPERYDFSDFRRVDGIMVPMKIVWSRADYQVSFVADRVRHNVPARGRSR